MNVCECERACVRRGRQGMRGGGGEVLCYISHVYMHACACMECTCSNMCAYIHACIHSAGGDGSYFLMVVIIPQHYSV